MSSLGLLGYAGLFVGSGIAVWFAGVQLSRTTDVLDSRFGLGEALGGLLLLAVATNLPEIAIVGAAALQHQFDIATGNILGGIAIQTLVLAALDGFGVRRRPLTNATASLVQVLEGALVMGILGLAILGTLLPARYTVLRIDPSALGILIAWIGGLFLVRRASQRLPWVTAEDAPTAGGKKRAATGSTAQRPTGAVISIFIAASLVTLAGGVGLEISGSAIADGIHLNGAVFGGTVLAAATALPELTTGLAAVRSEDFELAVSDIFGGNAFLPVLFFPATLLAGESVLGKAHATDALLACLGIALTAVYVFGLIFRPRRQYFRLGPDSLIVIVLYVLGIAALFAVSQG